MHTEAGSSDDWSKSLSSHPRNIFLRRLINLSSSLDDIYCKSQANVSS